jgi:hypothetical protein
VLVLVSLAGCAHTAGEVAGEAAGAATPPALTQALRTLNEPENRQLLGELMSMPEIRNAANNLAQGFTDGALDGLTDEERQARLREMSTAFVESLTRAMGQSLNQEITPQLQRLAASSVSAALDEAFSKRNQQQLNGFITSLTGTALAALATNLRSELGPAVRDMLQNDVGPGLAGMLKNGELDASLERSGRALSRGIVLGMDDALTQLDQAQSQGRKPSLLGRLTGAANKGIQLTTIVAIVLGIAVLALGLWIAKLIVQTRRDQAEAARREAAMTLMAEAIRATENKAWSPELRELLAQQFKDQDAGQYLEKLLRQQRQEQKPFH